MILIYVSYVSSNENQMHLSWNYAVSWPDPGQECLVVHLFEYQISSFPYYTDCICIPIHYTRLWVLGGFGSVFAALEANNIIKRLMNTLSNANQNIPIFREAWIIFLHLFNVCNLIAHIVLNVLTLHLFCAIYNFCYFFWVLRLCIIKDITLGELISQLKGSQY